MFKKYKNDFNLPLALLIMLITSLSGCASLDEDEPQTNATAPNSSQNMTPHAATTPNSNGYANNAKQTDAQDQPPQEGMIRIHRHGPGYDISMDINANDENVSFLMDLPQQKQIDKLKENIYASVKLVNEAQSLFYTKEYLKAHTKIDQAIELASDNAQAHALNGTILFKLQKTQDAVHAWERALELDSTLSDIITTLKKIGIKK